MSLVAGGAGSNTLAGCAKVTRSGPQTLQFDATRAAGFDGAESSLADGTGRLDYFADFGIGPDRLQEDDLASFQRLDPQAVRSQVQLTLPSSGTRIVYLYLLFWQPDARAAADYADLPALYQGMRQRLPDLEAATAAFGGDLPTSGDPGI